ncbi:hypothetical protein KHP62_05395 [Rhodobacteraceae bacterium NNCM2]|nr:hypothetical protein [Coraliihabitans acroporae]
MATFIRGCTALPVRAALIAGLMLGASTAGAQDRELEEAAQTCIDRLRSEYGVKQVRGVEAGRNNMKPYVFGNAVYENGKVERFRCAVPHNTIESIRFFPVEANTPLGDTWVEAEPDQPDSAEAPVEDAETEQQGYAPATPKFAPVGGTVNEAPVREVGTGLPGNRLQGNKFSPLEDDTQNFSTEAPTNDEAPVEEVETGLPDNQLSSPKFAPVEDDTKDFSTEAPTNDEAPVEEVETGLPDNQLSSPKFVPVQQ